jgi:uncharacterized protein YggE
MKKIPASGGKIIKYVFAFAALAGLCAIWHASAPRRVISATGVCDAKVQKDKFSITLQIKTLDKNAAASLRAVQNVGDVVARQIKAIQDETLEIQTTNLYSYEKTEWKNNTSVLLGIESEIDLEITTGSRGTINAVLDIAQSVRGAEAFPKNMKNFSSREVIAAAAGECLHTAIADARNKAAAIAAGDGEKLGRLLSAQFGSAASADVRPLMLKAASMASADAEYIQSAEGDLSIRVDAAFKIR